MVKLSKPSIQRFKEKTNFQIVSLADLFGRFKAAANGEELSPATFCQVAASIFATDQQTLLHAIFEYLDLDDSGTMDAGELLCALNVFSAGSVEEKVDICFDAFDLDENGWLSKAEFKNMLHTTLCTSRDLLIDLLGHFAEEDDPLTVDTVTLHTLKADQVELMADAAFDMADENKDGKIERHEFHAWATKQETMADFFATHEKLFAGEPADATLTKPFQPVPLPGAVKGVEHLTADDADLLSDAKPHVEEQAGTTYDTFVGICVRRQVVAGTNYFFKVDVGNGAFVHAKIFQGLPHTGGVIECGGVQKDKKEEDVLEYF